MDICRFCHIADGHGGGEENAFFMSTDEYFAMPSIGSLVEGWALVCPKRHAVSSSKVADSNGFWNFVYSVGEKVQEEYGSVVVFEHGAIAEGSLTGCGVDHAHVHIVPIEKKKFRYGVDEEISDWETVRLSEMAAVVRGREYLMHATLDSIKSGYCMVHFLGEPRSQFFRKIIARALGVPDKFDYKKFRYLENAIGTYKRLEGRRSGVKVA